MKISLLNLAKLIQASYSQITQKNATINVEKFYIDSRKISVNSVFVAIEGVHQDGHNFIQQAIENGAVCLIVNEQKLNKFKEKYLTSNITFLAVKNTLQAFHIIAKEKISHFKGKIIAITGSYGKTTTKEILTHILKEYYPTLQSEGNQNNELGVPLTALKLKNEDFAVFEMGARNKGDIAVLANIIQPHLAIITTIDAVHLEIFKHMDNIAQTKGEIIDFVQLNGICILNKDNPYFEQLEQRVKKQNKKIQTVSFSFKNQTQKNNDADYQLNQLNCYFESSELIISQQQKQEKYQISSFGKSIALNAFIAIITAKKLGLNYEQISKALLNFKQVSGRMEIVSINERTKVIYDAYNASPQTLLSAVESAEFLKYNIILVVGDMGELGSDAEQIHKNLGIELAKKHNIELVAIGKLCKYLYDGFIEHSNNHSQYFEKTEQIQNQKQLIFNPNQNNVILLKASRAMAFESILQKLQK